VEKEAAEAPVAKKKEIKDVVKEVTPAN